MPLTDLAIRQAKPQDKPYHLPDGGSLFLEVTPAGGKRWLFRYRFNGKPGKLARMRRATRHGADFHPKKS